MTGPTRVVRRMAVAGALTIGAELAAAVLWPVPEQPSFDASALLGEGDRPLRVAGLGDSTLTGPGAANADEIWIRVVGRRLSNELDRSVDLRSFGVGGATAGEVVAGQLDAALAFAPHLALVSVGANDVIRGVPMRRFAGHLDRIVSALTDIGAVVVLSGVGDLGTIPRLAPPLRHVVTRLGRRAERVHTVVAERHGAIKAEQWGWSNDQFRTRRDVWSGDLFHPNAAGHVVWAETCWKALVPILDDFRS
ncbi:MAG TPA: GDSL-type esterase/lipase family protein [Acidimicrobiia bacterium]|nr:GDSL-type esterase/lipase family protein [Acidimicrobiia bacterium]